MNALNTFLGLLGVTQGRDKVLRLIQYACLHSVDHKVKGSTFKVYEQMRMVRKMLRFFRTLQHFDKIRQKLPLFRASTKNFPQFLKYLTSILQNLFTILFYLNDHRVFLSELKLTQKTNTIQNFRLSMKFYFLENFFGVLNNLVEMGLEVLKEGSNVRTERWKSKIKRHAFDLIKCLLDCLVALYYWKLNLPAKKIGILGVITSLMGILQIVGIF